MPLTGAHHVALTVTDLARSREWYTKLFDWKLLFDGEDDGRKFAVGMLPSGLILGLSQHADTTGSFEPSHVGLDHLAFAVPSRSELPTWEQRFTELGVEFTPTTDAAYGHVLNFKDPDGIALEIFAVPETDGRQ